MSRALVIAEHDNRRLQNATLKVLRAAVEISSEVDLLVAGNECGEVVVAASRVMGIDRLLVVDHPLYAHGLAENLALLVAQVGRRYSHLLAPADTFGKNFLPRVAALLDVAQVSDIVAVLDEETFARPIYAGNAFATVRSTDPVKVITVRASAFDAISEEGGSPEVEVLSPAQGVAGTTFIRRDLTDPGGPDLGDARVVVAGGRGLGSVENFRQLGTLADRLDAAIGGSRAAVDAGYVSNGCQVGQTGKIVAPELYIAVGISGAIQHLAGMLDSRVIVAINNDPAAPIFQVADYGLVADWADAVPALVAALDADG